MSKDAQVVGNILREMSIADHEPQVVHQLMEFVNRYVTQTMQEAQQLSSYAKKDQIDVDDVQLSMNLQSKDKTVDKEKLMEIAREKNNQPLPPIRSHNGLRIPFDKYTLIGTNYKLKSPNNDKEVNDNI